MSKRGFFYVGCLAPKLEANVGGIMRSASIFGAAGVFTIGQRYQKQNSDTVCSIRHLPLFHYKDAEEFFSRKPLNAEVVAVELDSRARPIKNFVHPARAIYLLGPEDGSIDSNILDQCKHIIKLPGKYCLNLAAAGTCVLFDRINKSRND